MKAFKEALQPRYPGEVVAVRLDTFRASLYAVKKRDGQKDWERCAETLALPPGILLQGYNPRKSIVLPGTASDAGTTGTGTGAAAVAVLVTDSPQS
jgi:hypothetical protein